MITSTDLTALLPGIVISVGAILVLVQVSIKRNHLIALLLTCLSLVVAILTLFPAATVAPRQVISIFIVDGYALFFMGLIFSAAFMVAIMGYHYLKLHDENREDFYIVLLLAVLGAVALVSSTHFVSLFLGLETLSVPLYIMIAYLRTKQQPLEAGIKYLVLAAASSAFLLMGMALIYAELGTMEFNEIASAAATAMPSLTILTGTALFLVGIGFKLAVVPFHLWTPDVYQGAPAPVTAFVATVSKGAMLAVLLRYFLQAQGYAYESVMLILSIMAVASILLGNLLALLQDNVKRILAYSSIAHLGYLLVAFIAGGRYAVEAVSFYLVAYFVTILGSFGVIAFLSDGRGEKTSLGDYRGLFWRQPLTAGIFTAMLLSLAGIPLTAGFVGKFYVLIAGVDSALWALVIVLVAGSAIGIYYYLRIVATMFAQPEPEVAVPGVSRIGGLVLTALTVALLYVGVYPGPLVRLIRNLILGLL